MRNFREEGRRAEDAVVDYLQKKGYRILERNFRYDRGEIDIIAEDSEVLVFVEVKARRTKSFGDPEDAVTASKCLQIQKVAEGFFYMRKIDDRPYRFDVVAVEYEQNVPSIRHIEDAF